MKNNINYLKIGYFFNNVNWLRRAHSIGLSNRVIIVIISLSLMSTITEVFGIGIFLPIFQFIRLGGDMEALAADSNIWQYIINTFAYFSIKPSLLLLLIISFLFFIAFDPFLAGMLV